MSPEQISEIEARVSFFRLDDKWENAWETADDIAALIAEVKRLTEANKWFREINRLLVDVNKERMTQLQLEEFRREP